jgi:hypothetical protein
MVGTQEAATLLGISPRRLRCLLQENRVYGAYKVGRIWLMPLVNGLPKIETRDRGVKSTWKKAKPPAKTQVNIHRKLFGKKDSNGDLVPVITVKRGDKNTYCHRVLIPGPCEVVYDYDHPRHRARAWIETYGDAIPIGNYTYKEVEALIAN